MLTSMTWSKSIVEDRWSGLGIGFGFGLVVVVAVGVDVGVMVVLYWCLCHYG